MILKRLETSGLGFAAKGNFENVLNGAERNDDSRI